MKQSIACIEKLTMLDSQLLYKVEGRDRHFSTFAAKINKGHPLNSL